VKNTRERAEEKRAEKLEQVESGSLVIRRMTAEERRRYPRSHRSQSGPGGGEHAGA